MFKKWKKKTTTSPSGRHLRHHHSVLVPDGIYYELYELEFSNNMWQIHQKSTSVAMVKENPLNRWLIYLIILLPKDVGRPKIHLLRIIILRPKEGMKKSENQNWLGLYQQG